MAVVGLLHVRPALLRVLSLLTGLALVGCTADKPLAPRAAPEIVSELEGETFRLSDHQGRVVVLSFGYTFCPDVCPTTLSTLKGMQRELGGAAEQVSVVFVSVDPTRDSPARLRSYLQAFDPRFHAVSLQGDALVKTLDAYGVTVRRRLSETRREPGMKSAREEAYSLDHSSGYWLIDSRGQLRERIAHGAQAEALAAAVRGLLKEPAPLRVEAATARLTPNGLGAVYLKVVNAAGREDRLLSARTQVASRVELHEVVAEDDVVRMEPRPAGFEVASEEGLSLEPGGKHLMLYGVDLQRLAAEGARLKLALHFEQAGTFHLEVPVQQAWAEGSGK